MIAHVAKTETFRQPQKSEKDTTLTTSCMLTDGRSPSISDGHGRRQAHWGIEQVMASKAPLQTLGLVRNSVRRWDARWGKWMPIVASIESVTMY